MTRFKLKLDPLWKIPLLVIGVHDDTAYVEVTDDTLEIHFGHSHETIPRADIGEPERKEWSTLFYGLGVRVGPDGIAYVGSSEGVVNLPLKKAHAFRVLFQYHHDFSGVALALEEPDAFIEAVRPRA